MVRSTSVRHILVLSSGAAAGVGMARFGFGPLLPAMRSDLGWSLSRAGFVQSANLAAYLVGSFFAPAIIRRHGLQHPFALSYVAVALSLIGTGLASSTTIHVALRLVAGLGAAILWISGGTIAARLASDESSGLIIGLFFGGLGFGVVATGLLIPLAFQGDERWRLAWLVMGSASALAAPLVVRSLGVIKHLIEPPPSFDNRQEPDARPSLGLLRLEASYFLFGLGSIGYMTFVVALLRSQEATTSRIALFWVCLGIAIIVAGRLWATPISKSRSGRLLSIFHLIMAGAGLITVLSTSATALIGSGLAFGSVFVAAVTATTHLIRLHLPSEVWTKALARFTVGFGLALTIGSSATGMIADRYTITTGIVVSVGVMSTAAITAFLQPSPTRSATVEKGRVA